MTDEANFGMTLRKRRTALRVSQHALADAIQRPQCLISHIELGYIRPSAADRERIEAALDGVAAAMQEMGHALPD